MSRVSVIIPTYNRVKFLVETIHSVLHQTFQNFEIIICDNHSIDQTKTYCQNLTKTHKNIKYIRNKKNVGMVGNWNVGIENAKCEYISLLMDDDLWDPSFLFETVKILDKNSGVGFVHTWIKVGKVVNGETKIQNSDHYRYFKKSLKRSSNIGFSEYISDYWRVGLPSAVLFRKNEKIKFEESSLDPGFWLDYCAAYPHYYYLDKPLCIWRVHEGASFTSAIRHDRLYERRLIYNLNKAYNQLLKRKLLTENLEISYRKKIIELINL